MEQKSKFRYSARLAIVAGFTIFPLVPGLKIPAVKGWQRIATARRKEVDRLWRSNPSANIGIRTGGESGLFVLDVDGDEGRQSVTFLQAQNGQLPRTVTVRTPRGKHYYFFTAPPSWVPGWTAAARGAMWWELVV